MRNTSVLNSGKLKAPYYIFIYGALTALLSACGSGDGDSGAAGGSDKSFSVSTNTSEGVSLSPASLSVQENSTGDFSVTLENGYELASVTGCGGQLNGLNYTTGPITGECTVEATAQKKLIAEQWVIPAPADYFEFGCSNPVITHVIPANLNGNEYNDLIVHLSCDQDTFGESVNEPTPDALVTFFNNGDGSFEVANTMVFNQPRVQLGGTSRKYDRGDFTGNGRDDFIFATNWEDGRSGNDSTVSALPAIMIADDNALYSIINVGVPVWHHAVRFVPNPLGGMDAVFVGFTSVSFQAFRMVDGQIIDVSDEYPDHAGHWASGFQVLPTSESENLITRVVGSWASHESDGFEVVVRDNDGWRTESRFEQDVLFLVDMISWSHDLGQTSVVEINGERYLGPAFEETCLADNLLGNNERHLVALSSAMLPQGGEPLVEGGQYVQGPPQNILMFFEFDDDNQLQEIESPIQEQEINVTFNFFDCVDLNNNGLTDIVAYAYTRPWTDEAAKDGKPFVYLNDGHGTLVRRTLDDIPSYSNASANGPELQNFMIDMNNDGTRDLLMVGMQAGHGNGDIEISIFGKTLQLEEENPE